MAESNISQTLMNVKQSISEQQVNEHISKYCFKCAAQAMSRASCFTTHARAKDSIRPRRAAEVGGL